jgi:putative cell wall-binding protein
MLHAPRRSATGLRARAATIATATAVAAGFVLVPSAAHAATPTATNDAYSVGADSVFTTAAGLGVLANDLGLDVSALVQVQGAPTHGTLGAIGAGGVFTYTPAAGYVGVDVFTYCIALPVVGCVSANATVTLTVAGTVERIGGADRYAVSANVSAAKFAPNVPVAYIASGEVFPDALSASASAGAKGGPVLLVSKGAISDAVGLELARLKPQKIVVIGGPNTIDASVEAALQGYAPAGAVSRIGGIDRYAVSAGISKATYTGATDPGVPVAYVASGEVFPDALSGSAAAGLKGGPVLLASKDVLPAVVAAELARIAPARIVMLGGTNSLSATVETSLKAIAPTTRIAGADRFDVSAAVSASAFPVPGTRTVYVASGAVFPDALSGSAAAIKGQSPVLLVTKDAIPTVIGAELDRIAPTRIVVLGGPNTISDAMIELLRAHLQTKLTR